MVRKAKEKWEYGDFQTPRSLACTVARVVHGLGVHPRSVLEPTCGRGAFLLAAMSVFREAEEFVGVEANEDHLRGLGEELTAVRAQSKIRLVQGNFFALDWQRLLASLPDPILILGNPPWVTSAELGMLGSGNLPEKSNFQRRRGYDAITGKSNFDISEWMLLSHLDWLRERQGVVAMLCKTAVGRKVLLHAWKQQLPVCSSRLYGIDAQQHFGASVDACLLVISVLGGKRSTECAVYDTLETREPTCTIGFRDGLVIADIDLYEKWKHLRGGDGAYVWRSGVKHDCAKIMELDYAGALYRNGLGQTVTLEAECVYPLLKSSDIADGEPRLGRKCVLVTQRRIGEDTRWIQRRAPKTWEYLRIHAETLDKRLSSIYRNKPPFSVFGVGNYTFSPWKVAISGFYKRLAFRAIGPYEDKPVVFDDTVYFLPCWSESEAQFVARLLNSQPAQEFLRSMIFWSDKRPVTAEILKRVSLRALSAELRCEEEYLQHVSASIAAQAESSPGQMVLRIAEKRAPYRTRKGPGGRTLQRKRPRA